MKKKKKKKQIEQNKTAKTQTKSASYKCFLNPKMSMSVKSELHVNIASKRLHDRFLHHLLNLISKARTQNFSIRMHSALNKNKKKLKNTRKGGNSKNKTLRVLRASLKLASTYCI